MTISKRELAVAVGKGLWHPVIAALIFATPLWLLEVSLRGEQYQSLGDRLAVIAPCFFLGLLWRILIGAVKSHFFD